MISFNYQDLSSQSELFYIYLLLSSVLYLIFVQIDLMYLRWNLFMNLFLKLTEEHQHELGY